MENSNSLTFFMNIICLIYIFYYFHDVACFMAVKKFHIFEKSHHTSRATLKPRGKMGGDTGHCNQFARLRLDDNVSPR